MRVNGDAVLFTLRPGGETVGGIVDVSASGVRIRLRPGLLPEVGEAGALDLRVNLADGGGLSPALRLTGHGVVVRVARGEGEEREIALRFDGPLCVREAFGPPGPPLAVAPA